MPTVYDETYGPNGELISSTPRTVAEEYPLMSELYQTRKQVRAIALNNVPGVTVPAWGRVLAKFMLLITHYLIAERETEEPPAEGV
jgi:hypothetical protein